MRTRKSWTDLTRGTGLHGTFAHRRFMKVCLKTEQERFGVHPGDEPVVGYLSYLCDDPHCLNCNPR